MFDPKEETQGFFFHGVKQKARDLAKRTNKEMQFFFDRVFGNEASNADLYQGTTEGIISTLLDGYNCSGRIWKPKVCIVNTDAKLTRVIEIYCNNGIL